MKNPIEMSRPWITSKELKVVKDFMENGWYGNKKYYYVETFENKLIR